MHGADDVSRGFGFVEFEHEEDSLAALEGLKGASVSDRPITLRLVLLSPSLSPLALLATPSFRHRWASLLLVIVPSIPS